MSGSPLFPAVVIAVWALGGFYASLGPALVQLSISIGAGILMTAGLSFIGAGVRVPTPEWGLMIASGAQNMITGQWWIAFFPGLMIALTVVSRRRARPWT